MKKILLILGISLLTGFNLYAQDDDAEGNELIRQKMNEFIQKRLGLSKAEAAKFSPVFIRYFKEWRQTIQHNRGDEILLRQRIAELQIRYRDEFRPIIGERRSNQVFNEQRRFIIELQEAKKQRMNRRDVRPNKKSGLLLQ